MSKGEVQSLFMLKRINLAAIGRIDIRALLSVIIQWIMNKEWKQKDQVEGSCNRQMERVHSLKISLGDRVNRVC